MTRAGRGSRVGGLKGRRGCHAFVIVIRQEQRRNKMAAEATVADEM